MTRPIFVTASALLLLIATAPPTAAHDPITTSVTFSREIRAILAARCNVCHAPGGPAPMPLTTYDETRPWARAIKDQILTRRMPKWHAAHGFGAFANDPSLTPFEMALIVSWVDGGLPRGTAAARRSSSAPGSDGGVRLGARKSGDIDVTVPANRSEATRRVRSGWIGGWQFHPGDPLTTSATISLADGTVIGTWVAGDRAVRLPSATGIRVTSAIHLTLQRREKTDYEHSFVARPSVLRLAAPPAQRTRRPAIHRAWTERVACNATGSVIDARILAVRPVMEPGHSARIAVDRTGAMSTIVGWFRDFDPAYPRTYWLASPLEFGPDARLSSDAPCEVWVTMTAGR